MSGVLVSAFACRGADDTDTDDTTPLQNDSAQETDPPNNPPQATNDAVTTDEDVPVRIDVLGNDTDLDGDVLEITALATPSSGSAVVAASGQVEYTPAMDFSGTDSFEYTVSDGNGGEATGEVQVEVAPVNDAPGAVDDDWTTDEDVPLVIDVLVNDTDADGDTLAVVSLGAPASGSVLQDTTGGVAYTPAADFNGVDTFTYTVADPDGLEAVGTVTVNVHPLPDAPSAVPDAVSTPEDTALDIDVLANDTHPDGESLSVVSTSDAAHGTLSIEASSLVRFTPEQDFNGIETFDYTVRDTGGLEATATVSVDVTAVNDAPVAVDDEVTTLEDTPVLVDVLANDTDVDGDALSVVVLGIPSFGVAERQGDSIFVTPPDQFSGEVLLDYTISDPEGLEAVGTLKVTVTDVNDPPEADELVVQLDEDTVADFRVEVIDPEGDPVSFGLLVSPDGGVLSGQGPDFTYTPGANFNGNDSAELRLSDGKGGVSTVVVRFVVAAVNDPPTAENATYTFNQDTEQLIDLEASDVDGDPLEFTIEPAPAFGTLSGTAPNLTYTPDPGFWGDDSFGFSVSDGTETAEAVVTLGVNPVDVYEGWVLQYQDSGRDTKIDFISYDNSSYTATSLFSDLQRDDGFAGDSAITVDEDYNAYFYTKNAAKLFAYDYETLTQRYEIDIGGTHQHQGLAYVDGVLYLRSNVNGGQILRFRAEDGSSLSSITNGVGSSSEGGLRYSHTTHALYWPLLVGGNIDMAELDLNTEQVTVHTDLLPDSVSSAGQSIRSYTIDFEGNHYFIYFTDFNGMDKALVKYDPDLNLVWKFDFNIGDNTANRVAVDLQRDVYITRGGSTVTWVHKFETDASGNNPQAAWTTEVLRSNSLSPGIVDLYVERSPEGRVFTLHSATGGLYSFRKSDGGGKKKSFGSSPGHELLILPGKPHAVP